MSASLRMTARELESNKKPSSALVLARLEHLQKLFKVLPNDKIDLDSYICAIEKPGKSVHACGAVGCLGGWAALEFAPANFKVSAEGRLYQPNTAEWPLWHAATVAELALDIDGYDYDGLFAGRVRVELTPRKEVLMRLRKAILVVKLAIKQAPIIAPAPLS